MAAQQQLPDFHHMEPVPSQAGHVASAHWTLSTVGSKHKGVSTLFAFPIFVNVSDGAGCGVVMNQVEFWGCIKELFLFQ